MLITLQKPGVCRDCGTALPVGTRAKWYRNGATYGIDCHSAKPRPAKSSYEPLGQTLSRHDRYGVYSHDGRRIGRISCGCEDYPCCGH